MSAHQVPKYVGLTAIQQPAAPSGGDMAPPNLQQIRQIVGGKRSKKARKTKKAGKAGKSRKQKTQKTQQKQSGGFLPSIGEPFVAAVTKYIAPLALYGVYKFINGSKKTRKVRKSRK